MKFLIVAILASVCCSALGDRISEVQANAKLCSQQHNIPIDDIHKAMTGTMNPTAVTQNLKCMYLCMSDKEGITKDGVLQPQALLDILANAPNKDAVPKGIAACKDLKGTDNCDTAYKVISCLAMNKAL